MKRIAALVTGLLLLIEVSSSQVINNTPLSARLTGYRIDAELNPDTKTIHATMKAWWINNSDDVVPDVRLHMYLNAFRSNKSTFYLNSARTPGNSEKDFGWVEIKSISDARGRNLASSMSYISPDDGNPDDKTVLKVTLPEPARPGDTVILDISFVSKLPSAFVRTGYNDDYFFVAQWFPKFGVYEHAGMRQVKSGGWNCHQFHPTSEFYANHSVYDVNITLPKNYIVGTGGMTLGEMETDGGKKTIKTRAEDIVDYAWTAWPEYAVATDQWKHVKITFLYPPERKDQVTRQLQALKNALEYLTANVGPYPWPHVTFVDPPLKGSGAGGMEYTTLFTSTSFTGIPDYLHLPEMVTVHEFGHAYFMGILASNEFEEPWLDEGVNSFWEQRIMDHYYGPGGMINHPLFKLSDQTLGRMNYVMSPSRQAASNAEYSWNYPHGTYSMMSYLKTATWLNTLMGIIGEETMNEVFREYYREWGFRHPSGKDFIGVVNKVVTNKYGDKFGPDMNWYFDQVLYGTGICDYKVIGIVNRNITGFEGMINNNDTLGFVSDDTEDDTLYKATAQLERPGDIMLPVDVLIHFDNGEEVTEHWDGKSRYMDYSFTGSRKIVWVKIDPQNRITMDVNYINNSMSVSRDKKPIKRITGKMTSLMQFFISLISL